MRNKTLPNQARPNQGRRHDRLPLQKCFGLFTAGTLLCTLLGACGQSSTNSFDAAKSASKTGFYLDTVITVSIYGTDNEEYIDDCFTLADQYENMFSNTIETSEISLINASAGSGEYTTVSDETLELLNAGISYAQLSDGAFDITVGTLSDLWGISEIADSLTTSDKAVDESYLPTDEEIAQALATVDYTAIEINGNEVRLNHPDARIDLGSIAKGYIADQMKTCLEEKGVQYGLINLGGNVLTIGTKVDGNGWNIGLQKPFDETGLSMAAIRVEDKSVVTSGIYERYFTVDDVIYHHILDLTTGYPCRNNLYAVTIISDSSMDGDALSTTCFVLGMEKGMELIESLDGVDALFITDDLTIHKTSGIDSNYTLTILE